jgi:cell division transport system permease protein
MMRAASSCMKVGCTSMTDAIAPQANPGAHEPTAALARPEAHAETPIVPGSTISGRALVGVIAIMTFLASLTIGTVMLVRVAANDWQADVGREVTIQVRATEGHDIETEVARTIAISRAFPGVTEVRAYSKEETTQLLEPWLGSGLQFDDLPVPRIIVMKITAGAAPDIGRLRKLVGEQIPGASLDDHRGFVARMRAMASATLLAGIAVLLLVLAATVLSVTFATRAAMSTNRHVIEVLHLIGAKDNFIAAHFQQHFLNLGLKGGLLGGGIAVFMFACIDLASDWFIGTAAGDQFAAMFGTFSIGALGYLAVLVQIGLVAAVTAMTSRRTVNRTIETM